MWTDHFWMGGMWIFPFIMIIIVLFVIFMVFGRGSFIPTCDHYSRGHYPNEKKETPLEVLKKRYAHGEINKEEFDKIKKDIL